MCDQWIRHRAASEPPGAPSHEVGIAPRRARFRRALFQAGAGFVAGGAAAHMLPHTTWAQGIGTVNADPELRAASW